LAFCISKLERDISIYQKRAPRSTPPAQRTTSGQFGGISRSFGSDLINGGRLGNDNATAFIGIINFHARSDSDVDLFQTTGSPYKAFTSLKLG
jgi:hypothetical protein